MVNHVLSRCLISVTTAGKYHHDVYKVICTFIILPIRHRDVRSCDLLHTLIYNLPFVKNLPNLPNEVSIYKLN